MEADSAADEASMVAYLGQQAMAAALTARATNEEAIAAGMMVSAATLRAGDAEHMQD